ncbi:hypothetical protein [Nonomuraea composti]|uniref:hypothetical protein n=1 Tax=Nonomuraea composti TaxID=2720023 RepID=UPI001981F22C|nr:hypothetical protein [Nonomuraea sp. FMUSA5-5]
MPGGAIMTAPAPTSSRTAPSATAAPIKLGDGLLQRPAALGRRLAGGDVAVERADTHAGEAGAVVEAQVEEVSGVEELAGLGEQGVTVAPGVGAQRLLGGHGHRVARSWPVRYRETLPPGHDFDLIVLSVPHHRLPEAAAFLAPRVGDATVLVFGTLGRPPSGRETPGARPASARPASGSRNDPTSASGCGCTSWRTPACTRRACGWARWPTWWARRATCARRSGPPASSSRSSRRAAST